MAQSINTNVASLTAQRNLNTSQGALSTSLQRLSSGLRINSAKDDAAGLAISDRMGSQIRGLNQAARNANDGISMAQTAEGALGTIGDNLQRMRELSVQSANGSLSSDDRKSIQGEISQLKNEINRVANQTNFNGAALFDGTAGETTFQVGANANETIAINSLGDARSISLGSSTYASADGADINTSGTTSLTGKFGSTATTLKVGGFSITTADPTKAIDIQGPDFAVADNTKVTAAEYKAYLEKTVDAINVKASESGVSAQLDIKDGGKIAIKLFSDHDIKIAAASAASGSADYTTDLGLDAIDGTTSAAKGQKVPSTGFDNIDVSTVSGANKAMSMLDGALNAVNSMRGDLGAIQNRFESTIANLQTTTENLSASQSRIQDTDFAAETASLSRSQILQQAGTAMLAQANALPQNVLSLLR